MNNNNFNSGLSAETLGALYLTEFKTPKGKNKYSGKLTIDGKEIHISGSAFSKIDQQTGKNVEGIMIRVRVPRAQGAKTPQYNKGQSTYNKQGSLRSNPTTDF